MEALKDPSSTSTSTQTMTLTDRRLTTFLSLPRELRQAILLQSFDPTSGDPYLCRGWYWYGCTCDHKKNSKKWGVDLKVVHPALKDDMNFVEKSWDKLDDEFVRDSVYGELRR